VLTHDQAQALGLKAYHQRQKRDEQPVGRRLAPAEVRKLRGSVNPSTQKGRRDLAILDLMLFAGLRCEETATLAAGDFRQDSGRWWIVLTGKGSKTRRVKVHDVLYKSIISWCEVAGLVIGTGGCLFQSVNKGDRITPECVNPGVVNRIVAEYGELAGLAAGSGPNRLAPHDLRRTFARNAYDNGASLLLIQAQLGHSDPKTTARYIGAYQEDDNTAVDYVRY
jgi:integrase